MATLTGWAVQEQKVSDQQESYPMSDAEAPRDSNSAEKEMPVKQFTEIGIPVTLHNQSVTHKNEEMQLQHQSEPPADSSKTKCNSRLQWIVIGSILLIAVVAVVVAVITTTKLRSNSVSEQDSRKTQVLFVCEAVFMEQWMSGLQNHNSLEYRSKLLSIETQIDRAFRRSKMMIIYNRTHVTRLRPGSIIADFTVVNNIPDNDSPLDNGTVFVSIDDSGSKVDAVKLIENTLKSDVALNVDTKRIKVKVAASLQDTSTLPIPGRTTTQQSTSPIVTPVSGFFCALGRFRCGTGACIPRNWVCNGQTECQDGSDETLDTCGPTATTLTSDRTTETSFTVSTKEEETTFTALTETTEVIVDDATALPNQTLNVTSCTSDDFLCGDGETCRSRSARCNGYPDCNDASDELGCVEANGTKIMAFFDGELRCLCGNGTNNGVDEAVGKAVCHYLGRENLKSVSVDQNVVINGILIVPYPGAAVHFLGNFQASRSSECNPLRVECSRQATVCGRSAVPLASNYIQFGKNAFPAQWPWAVQLRRDRTTVCGGTLINRQWVLTAGHCIRGYAMSRFSVVIGSHQRSWYRVTSGREYRLIMTVTHENYSRANERSVNDLALLLLNETVTYSKYVQPVCLPRDELSNHDVCYALGWGEMSNGTSPGILQQTRVRTYSGHACNTLFRGGNILDSMVCASGYQRKPTLSSYTPTCYGDSGGPMVCLNGAGGWDLQGVISFGPPHCMQLPGTGYAVLSNVYSFKPWIQQKIDDCVLDCGDDTCIYIPAQLCDGHRQCADGRDETEPCENSVTCDFEKASICGYRNISESVRKWSPVKLINRRQNVVPYITDHTKASEQGTFMALRTGTAWMESPAVLESPEIPDSPDPSCLTFYFFISYISPSTPYNRYQRQRPFLKVLIVTWTGDSQSVWSVGAKFNPKWHLASVTLPPHTRHVRFQGLGHGAIDDVTHTPGGACPETLCEEEAEVKCPSTNVCVSKELFCDGEKQCPEEDLDENLGYCGGSVNCSFSDSYKCGFLVKSSGLLSWEWREEVFGYQADVTRKDSLDSHTLARDFTKAMALTYVFWYLPADENATILQSSTIVPEFNITTESCLEFKFLIYHLVSVPGNNLSARLSVLDVVNNNTGSEIELWTRMNSQGEKWRLGQLNLGEGKHNIRFQAEVNPKEIHMNIGLDDVRIIQGQCQFSVIACDGAEFRCSEEQCIPADYFCDGKQHCTNGADEYDGCPAFMTPRLVGGAPYANQGRVEVFINGRWQPICASGWDATETSAACLSLGYSNGTSVDDWQGSKGPIHPVIQVACTQPDSPLDKCQLRRDGRSARCDPDGDMAFVSCGRSVRYENMVRLQSSSGEVWKGMVEIHHNGSWGAVCNSGWDGAAANVTCRMLGYSGVQHALVPRELHGDNYSRPWLSGIKCHGNESFLHECEHDSLESANCTASEYVSVECITDTEPAPDKPRKIRLAEGTESYGRVEILYRGKWGTLCDDGVTQDDVVRICSEFGYRNGAMSGGLPPGTGPIWIDSLSCSTGDVSILDCAYSLDNHDCTHHEDVVVSCFTDCGHDEFFCHDNKTCVDAIYLCDGESDCPGGEDEDNCDIQCASDEFKCEGKQCVAISQRCDGQYHCSDGSDEAGCVQINGDKAVRVLAFGEWRPLCTTSDDDVTELAAIVCSVYSLSDVLTVSSRQVRENAWSASSVNGSFLSPNTTGIGGLRLHSASACLAVFVSCGISECGENIQPLSYAAVGKPSRPGEWPWHVRITERGSAFGDDADRDARGCEGVLLSSDWVLTAEKCLNDLKLLSSTLEVSGGAWTNGAPSWTSLVSQTNLSSEAPLKHKTTYHDMALLRLQEPVGSVNNSTPICLPGDYTHGSPKCYLTGWTEGIGFLEQPVTINVPNETCDQIVGNVPVEKPKCLRHLTNDVSCKNGPRYANPIVCQHPSRHWFIEGFRFFGTICLQDAHIDLFDSVRRWKQWLTETIRG